MKTCIMAFVKQVAGDKVMTKISGRNNNNNDILTAYYQSSSNSEVDGLCIYYYHFVLVSI